MHGVFGGEFEGSQQAAQLDVEHTPGIPGGGAGEGGGGEGEGGGGDGEGGEGEGGGGEGEGGGGDGGGDEGGCDGGTVGGIGGADGGRGQQLSPVYPLPPWKHDDWHLFSSRHDSVELHRLVIIHVQLSHVLPLFVIQPSGSLVQPVQGGGDGDGGGGDGLGGREGGTDGLVSGPDIGTSLKRGVERESNLKFRFAGGEPPREVR